MRVIRYSTKKLTESIQTNSFNEIFTNLPDPKNSRRRFAFSDEYTLLDVIEWLNNKGYVEEDDYTIVNASDRAMYSSRIPDSKKYHFIFSKPLQNELRGKEKINYYTAKGAEWVAINELNNPQLKVVTSDYEININNMRIHNANTGNELTWSYDISNHTYQTNLRASASFERMATITLPETRRAVEEYRGAKFTAEEWAATMSLITARTNPRSRQ